MMAAAAAVAAGACDVWHEPCAAPCPLIIRCMGTLSRPARASRQPSTAQSTSPISLHFSPHLAHAGKHGVQWGGLGPSKDEAAERQQHNARCGDRQRRPAPGHGREGRLDSS